MFSDMNTALLFCLSLFVAIEQLFEQQVDAGKCARGCINISMPTKSSLFILLMSLCLQLKFFLSANCIHVNFVKHASVVGALLTANVKLERSHRFNNRTVIVKWIFQMLIFVLDTK